MLPALNYLHGQPKSTGVLRSAMSDFKVFEQLPFLPCGEGEHLLIHIRKTGQNTLSVVKALAKYFKVKESLVSYAGLKDRFAITEQWFGVHVPGLKEYDLSDLAVEGVEVLTYKRHNKKLRIGALTGNKFELILREVTDVNDLLARWENIIETGVPNYFGEQRFGFDGANIDKALKLFKDDLKVKDKKKRGLYLSAARSYIFNSMVSKRIELNYFTQFSVGDVCMLAGTQSVFLVDTVEGDIEERLRTKDIDLTAAMWGSGDLMTEGEPKIFEQQIAMEFPDIVSGLSRFGLKQERRRIRLSMNEATIDVKKTMNEKSDVHLSFSLPAGCYATTILRELLNYRELRKD